MFKISIRFMLSVFCISLFYCTAQKQDENILVKIADKSITVEEFVRRAEYTVRPPYCKSNSPIHKKIVLNSLIAEKLMSLEAGADNEFITSGSIERRLRGRKEQAMRLEQYFEEAYDKAVVDSAETFAYFANAGRDYKISHYNILDAESAQLFREKFDSAEMTFEEGFQQLGLFINIPKREVSWNSLENDAILEALYKQKLEKGQLVGPVKTAENEFMFIKIEDWTSEPLITQGDYKERWYEVTKRLKEKNSKVIYDQFIYSVMKGKSIQFNQQTFLRLTQIMGPYYFMDNQQKQKLSRSFIFENREDDDAVPGSLNYNQFQSDISAIKDQLLFDVDGDKWNVADFLLALDSHPLVFRKNNMKSQEFGRQLQLAIIDLIRDKFLTDRAYEDGYDKLPGVQREFSGWQDNLNYQYYKDKYLHTIEVDSSIATNPFKLIDRYFNPHVDSLQAKYSGLIEVNMEAFNKIELSRIEMSVTQKNVPFAKPVPGFPLVTTDFRLDYGKKMEQSN